MSFFVHGGEPLRGEIGVQGAKNAALPIVFATLLTREPVTLYGLPRIGDLRTALALLRGMGVVVEEGADGGVTVLTEAAAPPTEELLLAREIRASAYLLGASLTRFGEGAIPYPGGCAFGSRPLDYHKAGFEALGASWEEGEQGLRVRRVGYHAAHYVLPYPSVGATVNYIFAALGTRGESTLRGYAREHHVLDLISFLRVMGAKIRAEGDTLYIEGGHPLAGGTYTVSPDAMEAGTYLIAAAATRGEVTVRGVRYAELSPLLLTFGGMRIPFRFSGDALTVYPTRDMRGVQITASPYPGFPTDLHPPMTVLLTRARDGGGICDLVWQDRFAYVTELRRMGAQILRTGHSIRVLSGELHGAAVSAPDLRGGAALLVAALMAEGRSEIKGDACIARGYEEIERKLFLLGARIPSHGAL